MHKNSHIARTFSTFLMCLMLMFTVFGKTFSASQRVNAGEKNVKTTQTDKQKQDPRACSVSELSVMQASTPISVDFSPEFTFTPQLISFVAPTLHSEVAKETIYRLSFHEILFEHFIATNAP